MQADSHAITSALAVTIPAIRAIVARVRLFDSLDLRIISYLLHRSHVFCLLSLHRASDEASPSANVHNACARHSTADLNTHRQLQRANDTRRKKIQTGPPFAWVNMASDSELDYLSPTFDPASLTVPRLRAILVSHEINYPSSAKKPQLIDIFTRELVPRSRKILAARSRTKRTSKGITDMPSSQEGTVHGDDDDEDTILMPPPPVPDSPKRKTRRTERSSTEDSTDQTPATRRTLSSGKSSGKHARESDTELGPDKSKQPMPRRTRRSEITPTVKIEEPEDRTSRSSRRESAFTYDNPFQSGSSPLTPNGARRKSSATGTERRISSSRRWKTEGVSSDGHTKVKQEDGIVVPSRKTFDVPVAKLRKSTVKGEPDDDGIEVGEEFTPEEQLDLVRARAANGEVDIYGPRKKKRSHKASRVPRSAPWVVIMTLLAGYATWWRREKIEVGYCGIGRPSTALANVQLPEWASALQPACESCPQHAYCYEGMETRCETDYVMKPHPLSLGGLIPLPPSCEPDGEKVRRVKAVADRAVEELRERKAKWECGDLVDEHGKDIRALEIDEAELKKEVAKKRRRGMSEAEFEDLWKGAIGEILGRDEVVASTVDG